MTERKEVSDERESAKKPHVMTVPRTLRLEPIPPFWAYGSQLIIFMLMIVLPPSHLPFQIDRPSVVDKILHLQRRHEGSIIQKIGL